MCKGNAKIKSLKEFDFRLHTICTIIRGHLKIHAEQLFLVLKMLGVNKANLIDSKENNYTLKRATLHSEYT